MSGLTKEQHLRIAVEDCEAENIRLQADHAAQREVNLALVAELAKVAADLAAEKARLDWFEAQVDAAVDLIPMFGDPPRRRVRVIWLDVGCHRSVDAETLRGAIDAAMADVPRREAEHR